MVSPAPTTAANPPPPLSYAERAKKAQNAKTTSLVTHLAPSTSGTRSAPPISRPSALKPPPHAAASTPSSRIPPSASPSAYAEAPRVKTPPSLDSFPEPKLNGDSLRTTSDSSPLGLPPTAPPKNVWEMRMAPASSTPAPAPAPAPAAPHTTQEAVLQQSSSSTLLEKTATPSPPITHPPANGHLASSPDDDDPLNCTPPIIDDAPPVAESGKNKDHEEVDRSHERESSQGQGTRKGIRCQRPRLGPNRSLRSSGHNSPATYAQPHPLPPQEFIPSRPYLATHPPDGGEPEGLIQLPDPNNFIVQPSYFPPPPPFGVSPYHSPHPSGSPANAPYTLPPLSYPGQPGMPPPVPMSGYGTPPYPMYPPTYGYSYGQPYMYWPPPGAPPSHPHPSAFPGDGLPPPTMIARPPPPSESDAVAGYRDICEERGPRTRELSFGSIGLEGSSTPASQGLSVVPEGAALGLDVGSSSAQNSAALPAGPAEKNATKDDDDTKSFTVFSIGVAPGEPTPSRIRSRTRTSSKGPAVSMGNQPHPTETSTESVVATEVVDMTNSDSKWEFGTTKDESAEDGASAIPPPSDPANTEAPNTGPPIPPLSSTFIPGGQAYPGMPPYVPPVFIPGAPLNGLPPPVPSPSAYAPRHPPLSAEDEWAVRDYGYGFGRGGSQPSYSQHPPPPREDRSYRREFQPGDRDQHFGRLRRGSYGQGGYGYERGGERGSFGGRRGRGLGAGYGGRGYSGRGYGRGGYAQRQQQQQQQQQAFVPPPQPDVDVNGYYAPPVPTLATYIPQAFEGYPYAPYPPPPPQAQMASTGPNGQPLTMPMPQTNVGFPLDSTRYYLLGQLEYYLSAQNMAQDFFLRQQMDSRGWIPIDLIAQFNRVLTLTRETHIVVEVLSLSSLVEVRGMHVRPHQWQQFVLPAAAVSTIEGVDGQSLDPADPAPIGYGHPVPSEAAEHPQPPEEDDEEDVQFILSS
ncbi:uncharacterized protein BXZ73DRAFT_88383 [Epithele typhae]|uniref:uncharacterized protein n=1 Tax=Epithele typhae TaxID=378194 RepID=UPI0020081115|nr:uncharacterized protein BXZ73DRAFT_88383 [Epithele typhae]KAH9941218.1 hypothetical protein BXZ73DRAFT_88383 [Epithele typhae]